MHDLPTSEEGLDMSYVKPRQTVDWKGREVSFCDWNHPLVNEPPISELLRRYSQTYHWDRLIKPGSLCVDVGAHSGDTTVPIGVFSYDHATGKPGKVLAVEPNRDVYPVLEVNTSLNTSWAEFTLSRYAVTKKDGEVVELVDNGNQNCNGGLIDPNFSEALQAQMQGLAQVRTTVEGIRLDTLLKRTYSDAELATLSFVKTDCEGYDKEILRASKDLIVEYKPFLFVEWYDLFPTMEDHNDLFDAISDLGFEPLNPETLQPASYETGKLTDLLLVHPSRRPEIADL
ncbi:FkbM family methyltransferase [Caulobacter radicis]|jgi:FkbM family methyltransferase|uniref:Methyltransferase FkbM domain-containing protein n=1 Tax=Caulobacter radicis TaxID=2172650 RepID=A0A2T9J1P6_9CAUL|nr:FkbM family methyltransferase [Caulobacter radicis]PVM74011.1 hypothetical protein DDF65_20625 [Caulobacter radicis]